MKLKNIFYEAWSEARKKTGDELHAMGKVTRTDVQNVAIIMAVSAMIFICRSNGNLIDWIFFAIALCGSIFTNFIPVDHTD